MDRAQRHTRGGNADGPRTPPRAKDENHEEEILQEELDETFPASDPPASTQPVGKEPPAPKPRRPD